MKPEKILILRFSSIGDIVITTSVIEYLTEVAPETELHFLTLSDYAPILEGNPNLERIIMVDRQTKLVTMRHLAKTLSELQYDLFLDLHDSLRTQYLRRWLTDFHWVVYRKPRIYRFLLFYLHVNRFDKDFDITSKYFNLLNNPNPESIHSKPTLYIQPQEKERSHRILARKGVAGSFICVVPGAAWRTKTWESNRYIQLLNRINKETKYFIVLLGSWRDSICDTIAEGVPGIVNLKGKTDLRTSLAILSCAKVVIGSDTGLVHGAEAAGTPVIMMNGPTSPETGAKTRAPESITLTTQLWCQPCSKNGSLSCYRKEQFCLTGISPDLVISSFKNIIAEA